MSRCRVGSTHRFACCAAAPGAVMVSCATRYLGPRGEVLYESRQHERRPGRGSRSADRPDRIRGSSSSRKRTLSSPMPIARSAGIGRSSASPRISTYGCGCARWADVWRVLRSAILATWSPSSISGRHGAAQRRLCGLAIEAAKRRRRGEDEAPMLARARNARARRRSEWPRVERMVRARTLYFIGSCLRQRDPARARGYFVEALRAWPLHGRSLPETIVAGPDRGSRPWI